MTDASRMFASSMSLSLIALCRQWRQDVQRRKARRPEDEESQRQEQERAWREAHRLEPTIYAYGLSLPITGDFVITKFVNGIAVQSNGSEHVVVVSTPSKDFIIPCASKDEAGIIRRNIARAGGFLYFSGGY